MNIITKTASGKYIVRPDTTWEKDNEDFFPPDYIESLTFTPALFARICKPGKSVGEKFVSRYYDSVNYGLLLYPENLIGCNPEDYACASCIDHTSFLSSPLFDKESLAENNFRINAGDSEIFYTDKRSVSIIENAIHEASARVYIRTGDLIAIELDSRKPLCTRADGNIHISGFFGNNKVLDFNIIVK